MFTFEQRIKAGRIRSVLYPKIIKETFELFFFFFLKSPNYWGTFEAALEKSTKSNLNGVNAGMQGGCEYLSDWLGPKLIEK